MLVFGQKWLFSKESSYIRANWLYWKTVVDFGQSGSIGAKVVLFGQSGCIRAKVVVFVQKWLY